jgi:hypothetical protein
MGLEQANTIGELDENNPKSTDLISQGNDHIKMIKHVLKETFEESVVMVQRVEDILESSFDDREDRMIHSIEFTPKFETSKLIVEYICGATAWSGGRTQVLSFQIWDMTSISDGDDGGEEGVEGIPITHKVRTLGFNKSTENVGGLGLSDVQYGSCVLSGDYLKHPGTPFTIEVWIYGIAYGDGGWDVADRHLIVTEYN